MFSKAKTCAKWAFVALLSYAAAGAIFEQMLMAGSIPVNSFTSTVYSALKPGYVESAQHKPEANWWEGDQVVPESQNVYSEFHGELDPEPTSVQLENRAAIAAYRLSVARNRAYAAGYQYELALHLSQDTADEAEDAPMESATTLEKLAKHAASEAAGHRRSYSSVVAAYANAKSEHEAAQSALDRAK